MAYLGLQPNTPLLNTSTETFSGDGIELQFTLARSIASASDLDVMIGSTLQRPGTDYEAAGKSLQFYTPPGSGTNNITVTYRAGALNSLDLTASAFNAGTVANPSVYSLAANNTGLYWANASSISVTVSGTNRLNINNAATSTTPASGALVVNGGIGIGGNINTSGRIVTSDTTESNSVSTGSFITAGGAAVVGNLNVGGDITCVGDFTVNGTFTTTGTDSLAVTDPFIFLATNNPGDTYDEGVVGQYFDGANTRYTGYFRDITDTKYKFFTNLLTAPTTTVDTTDPSFQYAEIVAANVSATGNVSGTYLLGNGALLTGISSSSTRIFNTNSEVTIPASNGNIINNVSGVNIANVWSGGFAVTGAIGASTTVSAAGNITGGNIQTAGLISASGNIVSAGNASGGNILTGGMVSSVGNVQAGNVNATTAVSAGGNVVGGNIRTSGIMSAVGAVYGDSINAALKVTAGSDVSAVGVVEGGTVTSLTTISAAGNISGSYFLGNGSQLTGIDAAGIQSGNSNVRVVSSAGNVAIGIGGTSNIAVFSTLGANVTGWIGATGNLNAGGNVAFTGTTQNINLGTSQTTGNVTIGGTAQTGFIQIGQSTSSQTINIGHGATGSGNTKTIQIGENGAAGSATVIDIGPVSATTAAGTVTFQTATVVAIANTSGTALSVAGNITGANISTSGPSGNITGANVIASTTLSATANIVGGNIITAAAVSAASVSASATVIAAGNITGGNILTGGLISGTGNITGGNLIINGLVTVTGNVTSTANVAGGNILATTMVQGSIVSATANIIATANVSGAYFLGTGISLTGNVLSAIATTGNITGANIVATAAMSAASVSATGNITGGNVLGGANVNATTHTGTTVSITGTVTAASVVGGVMTGSSVSVTGTVTGASVVGGVMSGTSLTVSTGAVTLGSIVNANANGVGNIGAVGGFFNTVFAKATSAQYADLAEWYEADADYEPGTVLVFGGSKEVTMAIGINDVRVAGVVSTNPAHIMNAGLDAEHTAALALTGRVPTLVVGKVAKGDMMVTAGGGRAQACAEPRMGSVIGKALQDHPGGQGVIEIVVGRL